VDALVVPIEEKETEGEGEEEGGGEEGQVLWGIGGIEKKQRMMEMT